MPRLVNQNPSYRKHKASGQAIVTLIGEDVYLGPYGSKQSRREYDRVISEWLARGRRRPGRQDGRRVADVLLRRAYGETPAKDFGPRALQVREQMVKAGWSRNHVNAQTGRLKRCFKWAASRELIPPSVFHGLQSVVASGERSYTRREERG